MLTLEEQYAVARGVQRGDPDAARLLLVAFRPLMIAIVDRLAYIHRGTSDYEDYGAMVEAWTFELTRDKYQPEKGTLAGFLEAQLRFRLLDKLRRRAAIEDVSSGPPVSVDELSEVGQEPVGEDGRETFLPNTERAEIAAQIVAQTRAALDDDYLLAILEMKLAGLGVRPIARTLGVSPAKVDRDWRQRIVEPVMRPTFERLRQDLAWIADGDLSDITEE